MIKVSIRIDRPINVVWDYFTKPENWIKWYGGGLKEVVPGWQNGGNLFWALGGSSPLSNVIPQGEISISGAWIDKTFKFIKIDNSATTIEIIESDPKGGAFFNDGGKANREQLETNLLKLKVCIESETEEVTLGANPKEIQTNKENTGKIEARKVQGKKASLALLITGYIFAVLGGLIGLIIGLSLHSSKIKLQDGSVRNKYDKNSRTHGYIINFLALIMMFLGLILMFNNR